MDIFLTLLGFIFIFLGIIGSLVPVLPGPLLSWLGIASIYSTSVVPGNSKFLWISFLIMLIITLLDYFTPMLGTKKFGGSKAGMNGALVGGILGIFLGPLGIVFGPFIGALLGEIMHDNKDLGRAFKAAIGSFVGFVLSTMVKVAFGFYLLVDFFQVFWFYKGEIFA